MDQIDIAALVFQDRCAELDQCTMCVVHISFVKQMQLVVFFSSVTALWSSSYGQFCKNVEPGRIGTI